MLTFYCSTMKIDRHTKSKMEDRSITFTLEPNNIIKKTKIKKKNEINLMIQINAIFITLNKILGF